MGLSQFFSVDVRVYLIFYDKNWIFSKPEKLQEEPLLGKRSQNSAHQYHYANDHSVQQISVDTGSPHFEERVAEERLAQEQRDGTTDTDSDDQAKADLLNSFFAEQTHLANVPASLPDLSLLYADGHVADSFSIATSPSEVFDTFIKLKTDKATGKNTMTPERLLSKCAPGITNCLDALFNRSCAECAIPAEYREALVVPIFKSGSRSAATNYRPIALLIVVSKVLEKIVHRWLSIILQAILSSKQCGFASATTPSSGLPDWSNNGLMLWKVTICRCHLPRYKKRLLIGSRLLHKLESAGVRGSALHGCSGSGTFFRCRTGASGQSLASRFLQLNIYMPVFHTIRSWALFCFRCTWMILLLSPTVMWIFLPMTHQSFLCRTLCRKKAKQGKREHVVTFRQKQRKIRRLFVRENRQSKSRIHGLTCEWSFLDKRMASIH